MDPTPETSATGLAFLLSRLHLDAEAEGLLTGLHRALPPNKREDTSARQLARTFLNHLGEGAGWESPRVSAARAALRGWLGEGVDTHARVALVFGGQATAYFAELEQLSRGTAAPVVAAIAERWPELAAWLSGAPAPDSWSRPSLSFPLIFATQVARLHALLALGLSSQRVVATAGHSQGVFAALYANEILAAREHAVARAVEYVAFLRCFGARVESAFVAAPLSAATSERALQETATRPSPMAALTGVAANELAALIAASACRVFCAIDNGARRLAISGEVAELERFRRFVMLAAEKRKKDKLAGQWAGPTRALEWSYLAVDAPFHSPLLESAVDPILEDARTLGFTLADLPHAVRSVCTAPGDWSLQLRDLLTHDPACVLDLGPSDATARLCHASLRGTGVSVSSSDADLTHPSLRYADFAPTAARLGTALLVDNHYTRTYGRPPIFLAGMTPTTVEARIVAAAANAGFVAELAGGGQVTERILRLRLDELRDTLSPGQGVVFNTLYLDAYLWKLHFGPDRLLLRLRDEGYPLIGVTVSAGIPPVDEAAALLRELHAHGLWLNAFKPGNDSQIRDVLAIADACPEITFGMQIEGGRAGGHHSWEDLDDLLLQHYGEIRKRTNIVLSVGGGIGVPEKAAAYLRGTWHGGRALAVMPVDGVFIGTVAMAAKEACTSAAVKQALCAAAGADTWVRDGEVDGGVTSGRSQLDAHIHYLDNAATRAGRLLDSVMREAVTDKTAVERQRYAIIQALNATAKPYFGDAAAMTYLEFLTRFAALTAIGRGTRYEDGVWPDRSFRERFRLLLERAEARLCVDKRAPFAPLAADDPHAALRAFAEKYPSRALLHAADLGYFLDVCRLPGKPVNFVPVIDADVRRWYKADSLWQSHDDRYTADQVFTIPGPEAVAGISRADEPIAEMLARFNHAVLTANAPVRVLADLGDLRAGGEWGQGPLAAAVRAPDAVLAGRLVRNPLRELVRGAAVTLDGTRIAAPGVTLSWDGTLHAHLHSAGCALDLCLAWDGAVLTWNESAYLEAQQRFYSEVLFAGAPPPMPADAPLNFAFSLAWKEIFAALSGARPNVMALVHESNTVEAGPAWPPRTETRVTARVVALSSEGQGRHIETEAEIFCGAVLAARVVSRFFVRGAHTAETLMAPTVLVLREEAERAWLSAQPWLTAEKPLALGRIYSLRDGVLSDGDEVVARMSLREAAALAQMFTVDRGVVALTEARELGQKVVRSPARMDAFARASGDRNPLHVDETVAHLAGFASPIVHGMWTANAAADCARALLHAPLRRVSARFTGVVWPDEPLRVSVRQTGMRDGGQVARIEVHAKRDEDRALVLDAEVDTCAGKTAYVFPGQGIQSQNMGMAGYARSPAARAVWDEADAVCRRALGFSLLRVVRDNPRELRVGADLVRHPAGVLFLTQFTQAAMAVMAVAQVAELKALGAFVPHAMFAGHSIGEYSALAAVVDALPLAAVVQIVYQRGATMDHLVARDSDGQSPYAMGVIRPHDAGLSEADALALVGKTSARLHLPLEIVNYNIRGKQYAVTGDARALAALEAALAAAQAKRSVKAKRPAFLLVPGIDVPFHSRLLRSGVDDFRRTLDRLFPIDVRPSLLVDRYIPNLVARPFALTREFVTAAHAACDSPLLADALANWNDTRAATPAFARTLLIELLAYQFASPVRWIETQEIFFSPQVALDRLIEVGVGEQPVLSHMAKATLALDPLRLSVPEVLNSEAQRDTLIFATPGVSDPDPWALVEETAPVAAAAIAMPVARARVAGAVVAPSDPVTAGLSALLALQTKIREEQLDTQQTLDELLGGNSAKRNQVLADIGNEFGLQAIDGAHEVPLRVLAEKLHALAPRYTFPGRYLSAAIDQHLHKAFAPSGFTRKAIGEQLEAMGPAHGARVLVQLALRARHGESTRGGALGDAPTLKDRGAAAAYVTQVLTDYAAHVGLVLASADDAPSAGADPRAVRELEEKLQDVLARAANVLGGADRATVLHADSDDTHARLDLYESEHGAAYEKAIRPLFNAQHHVQWTSAWAWSRRDVVALYHALLRGEPSTVTRLHPDARAMAHALAQRAQKRGHVEAARVLDALATSDVPCQPSFAAQKPILRDGTVTTEPRAGESTPAEFLARCGITVRGHVSGEDFQYPAARPNFARRTALVTGASPGSIAFAIVRELLAGGARVIVTTQSDNDARLAAYQALYTAHAIEGAELHVVPFNQASFRDTAALVDWILSPVTRMSAGHSVKVKEAWLPDLIVPFAAMTDAADVSTMTDATLATLRVMVLGVERLLGTLAQRFTSGGHDAHHAHVLLPLSPNHGAFGGDGAYAESKAALATLLDKWRSERAAWGRFFGLVGAHIGWVRGTGLMDHNDRLAAILEAETSLRTFNTEEMAFLLVGLLGDTAVAAARNEPLFADISGGLTEVSDLAERAQRVAADVAEQRRAQKRASELQRVHAALSGVQSIAPRMIAPEPFPVVAAPQVSTEKTSALALEEVVVVVGMGELGPCGGSRTRWAMEKEGVLSLEGAIELAWLMGFITPRAATDRGMHVWSDADGPIDALAIKEKYEAKILAATGVRVIEGSTHGFDPRRSLSYVEVHLEQDFDFVVQSREQADTFVAADPEGTQIISDGDTLKIRRKKGATVRVPRALQLDRFVAGQIPEGWTASRYGVTRELEAQVDRITLYNLIATVEAFLAAGLEPEELYAYLHPSRVASSQSLGLGGMQKMVRLYADHLLGNERQSDAVQETLSNVVAGYAVQAYTGSYGAMQFPVGACASAAASVADAMAMLKAGVADMVVTGGADDFGEESVTGFGDMNATANTRELAERGISPPRMCRPNDRRRDGFVESHGAGTLLLCRASVALKMGLPVYGVIGYAGTFGDGIQASVPSPGIGALSAAPSLRAALQRFELCADDIAFVSKHDTSTKLNDENENRLHTWLQASLGRTPHLPLLVVSQKSLTGHPKGAAAAWQMIGALQAMAEGVVPGNRNLEDVDPAMREFSSLVFSDRSLRVAAGELSAALVTSLGFGHINGIVLMLHAEHFWRSIPHAERAEYTRSTQVRMAQASQRLQAWLSGGAPLFQQRTHRPFTSEAHEAATLMNPDARLARGADTYPR